MNPIELAQQLGGEVMSGDPIELAGQLGGTPMPTDPIQLGEQLGGTPMTSDPIELATQLGAQIIGEPTQEKGVWEHLGIENADTYWSDALDQAKNFIEHPLKTAKESGAAGIASIKASLRNVKEAHDVLTQDFTEKDVSIAKKVADSLHTLGAAFGVAFIPITAAMAAAEKLPALKEAADIMKMPFAVAGEVGNFAADKFVDVLPISEKDKEIIRPAFDEIGTLAGQMILGGKIVDMVSRGIRPTKERVDTAVADTKIKEEIAKGKLTTETPTEAIKQPVEKATAKIPVETNLTTKIEQTAVKEGFEPKTIKGEATKVENFINTEGAKGIADVLKGEKEPPADPHAFLIGVKEYLKGKENTPEGKELEPLLINSGLIDEVSKSAQTLSLGQKGGGAVSDLISLRNEINKRVGKTKENVRKVLKKAVKKVNLKEEDLKWDKFLKDIQC